MIKKASYVSIIALPVAVIGVVALQYRFLIGTIVLGLSVIPLAGIRKKFRKMLP